MPVWCPGLGREITDAEERVNCARHGCVGALCGMRESADRVARDVALVFGTPRACVHCGAVTALAAKPPHVGYCSYGCWHQDGSPA